MHCPIKIRIKKNEQNDKKSIQNLFADIKFFITLSGLNLS